MINSSLISPLSLPHFLLSSLQISPNPLSPQIYLYSRCHLSSSSLLHILSFATLFVTLYVVSVHIPLDSCFMSVPEIGQKKDGDWLKSTIFSQVKTYNPSVFLLQWYNCMVFIRNTSVKWLIAFCPLVKGWMWEILDIVISSLINPICISSCDYRF